MQTKHIPVLKILTTYKMATGVAAKDAASWATANLAAGNKLVEEASGPNCLDRALEALNGLAKAKT